MKPTTPVANAGPAPAARRPSGQVVTLARNAAANLVRIAAGWIILLIVPPLLVRLLDKPAYATWMLMLQIGAYATIFDGGLQLAIARYVARARQSPDRYPLGTVLTNTAALLIPPAFVLCAVTVVLAAELGRLFSSIPPSILPEAQGALLFIGLSLGIAFPTSVLAGLCLGLEKNQLNAIAGSIARLAGAAGTLWAAFDHQGLIRMAEWTALGNLLQPAAFLLVTRRFRVFALLRPRFFALSFAKEFLGFSSAMVVSQLSGLLISGLDLPIVAAWDFHNAGYYALAALVSNMLVVPQGAILSTIVPMMSAMTMGESALRTGRVLIQTTRLANALLITIAVPLMLGMAPLLRLWVGPDYARHTLLYGELLVAAQLIRLSLMPYTLIGFSAGEQKHMLASPVFEGLLNLAASLVLVRLIGAAGVALGTLIGAILGFTLHFLVSMRRTPSMAFRRRDLLWQGMLRPTLWALVPAAVAAAALLFAPSAPVRLLLVALTLVILCALLWKAHLAPEERTAVRRLGSHVLSAFPLRAMQGIGA